MTAEKVQKHIFISGRVQGVGFRAFIRKKAADLQLKGWAKNLADGRVEIVIQGDKNQIEKIMTKLKNGPSFARVDDLEVEKEKVKNFNDFEIRF